MTSEIQDYSHKRYNILTGEWVLVSPHRAKRPWQGQEESNVPNERPSYDANCFLCSGNTRANEAVNPNYQHVFIFTNDFSALQKNSKQFKIEDGLFQAQSEQGICKVVCFSPDHSKSLAELPIDDILHVVTVWQQEYINLGKLDTINYVQIFENKGAIMGCSNPHPHGQIWSQSSLPNEVIKKDTHQLEYFKTAKTSLLSDYLQQELIAKERVIFENEHFVILVPFWAIWPFETMIIPKAHQSSIQDLSQDESLHFAEAISIITKAYDRIFNCAFPYSSGIHQAPTNNKNNEHWHWHMSFYPPLLRSATIKKFMVGYEMFGSPQRDITAESASSLLKELIEFT
ncbi:galactose-1-phosphate uridylyltransferase [Flavobacteriales bacterium 34_180_T64]|nr:galactose-1-phosphate uridylyltransferase [Flavobacteriales bacterium 34_180_T64]